MGLSDWFRRERSPNTRADLREALIAAVADKDDAALADLLNENHEAIRRDFAEWTKVPEETRNDEVAMARYAEAMIAVATVYERSGDTSLMAALGGPAGDNPMEDWSHQLVAAQELIEGARAGEAIEVLTAVLRRMEEMPGTAREYYRPRTLGKLGLALYRAGDTRGAVQVTREALELCRQAGDAEGVKAYTGNIESMGTFEVASRDGSGARYAVVFRDDRGRMLELDDLDSARGRLEWEIRSHGAVPPDATALHRQGREAGSRGDYEDSVSTLTKAAALAPSWPYPVYDRAFTHMLKGDFDSALADYRRTIELAPDGFFTAAQSVDMLTREAAGEFPSGLYATFVTHGQVLAEVERRNIAEQIVEKYPGFTPAWEALADLVDDDSKRLEIIDRALATRPDRSTKGMLQIKKAITFSRVGESARAVSLLRQLSSDQESAPVTEAMARFALARIDSEGDDRR